MTGDTPFWDFSLDVYGRPGVPDACLLLQDTLGADVNLALFAAWLGRRGVTLDAARSEAARTLVGAWHAEVVVLLRGARRGLKGHSGPVPPEDAEALRGRVKAAELEAERLEQMALQALGLGWPAEVRANAALVTANLRAVLPAPLPEAAEDAVGRLAAAAMGAARG